MDERTAQGVPFGWQRNQFSTKSRRAYAPRTRATGIRGVQRETSTTDSESITQVPTDQKEWTVEEPDKLEGQTFTRQSPSETNDWKKPFTTESLRKDSPEADADQSGLLSQLLSILTRGDGQEHVNGPKSKEKKVIQRRAYSPTMFNGAPTSHLQEQSIERTEQPLVGRPTPRYPAKYDPIGHANLIEAKRSSNLAVTCYRCQARKNTTPTHAQNEKNGRKEADASMSD